MKMKRLFLFFSFLFVVFLCYEGKPEEYKVKHDIVSNSLMNGNLDNELEIIEDSGEGLVSLVPSNSNLSINIDTIYDNLDDNIEESDIYDVVLDMEEVSYEDEDIREEVIDSKIEDTVLDNDEEIEDNIESNLEDNNEILIDNVIDSDNIIKSGIYKIRDINNDKLFRVRGNSIKNGYDISLYNSNNSKNELWSISYMDNYYKISSVRNPNVVWTYNDGKIELGKWNDLDNQKWYINIEDNNIRLSVMNNEIGGIYKLEEYTSDIIYNGIDISYYQGNIDFKKLSNSDVDFVIVRAGYGDNYNSQDDINFINNIKGLEEYNISYGVYLYSYALNIEGNDEINYNSESVDSEISHVLRLLNELSEMGYRPNINTNVFYDMEDDSTIDLGMNKLTSMADYFCDSIINNSYSCGIYANKNWLTHYLNSDYLSSKYNIWLAEWLDGCVSYEDAIKVSPSYNLSNYKYWQFSSIGKIDGIDGYVDLDLGYDIFN